MTKYLNIRANLAVGLAFAFFAQSVGPIPVAQAQEFRLPAPGIQVPLSPEFNPPVLRGLKVHPDNPFHFDFVLDQGDSNSSYSKIEAIKLIKYFLASLTIPENDLWVNLSPYEKNRIVPDSFGQTEMGRDLLAEDYMLKQITASLIYPEGEVGRKFWKRIYDDAARKFGTTNIPVNTFNKVWIIPEKAVVYENAKAGTAYVVESRLKVMLEQDYLSLQKHNVETPLMASHKDAINRVSTTVLRDIIIPELTKEVNEDKNFAQLRQVYNSLILAAWYKKKIKDSILAQVYADKNKTVGVRYSSTVIPAKAGIQNRINSDMDPRFRGDDIELIYQRYLLAFKKGVYNYIKEDVDPVTQQPVPRKYFSGGCGFVHINDVMTVKADGAMLNKILDLLPGGVKRSLLKIGINLVKSGPDLNQPADDRIVFFHQKNIEVPLPRLVAQGDVHGALDGLLVNLRQAKLIDEDNHWIGGNAVYVQIGDQIDRGPESREVFEFHRQLQIEAEKQGGQVIRLLGNHELMLLRDDFRYANFDDPEGLAEEIKKDIKAGKIKLGFLFGNRLFVHAGFRTVTWKAAVEEYARKYKIKTSQVTLENITEMLNRILLEAAYRNNFTDPILHQVVWNRDVMGSTRVSMHLKQVIGHTPGNIVVKSPTGGRINLDAGLFEGYGGNNSFLEIVNNEIMIHHLNESGVWEIDNKGKFKDQAMFSNVPPEFEARDLRIKELIKEITPRVNNTWIGHSYSDLGKAYTEAEGLVYKIVSYPLGIKRIEFNLSDFMDEVFRKASKYPGGTQHTRIVFLKAGAEPLFDAARLMARVTGKFPVDRIHTVWARMGNYTAMKNDRQQQIRFVKYLYDQHVLTPETKNILFVDTDAGGAVTGAGTALIFAKALLNDGLIDEVNHTFKFPVPIPHFNSGPGSTHFELFYMFTQYSINPEYYKRDFNEEGFGDEVLKRLVLNSYYRKKWGRQHKFFKTFNSIDHFTKVENIDRELQLDPQTGLVTTKPEATYSNPGHTLFTGPFNQVYRDAQNTGLLMGILDVLQTRKFNVGPEVQDLVEHFRQSLESIATPLKSSGDDQAKVNAISDRAQLSQSTKLWRGKISDYLIKKGLRSDKGRLFDQKVLRGDTRRKVQEKIEGNINDAGGLHNNFFNLHHYLASKGNIPADIDKFLQIIRDKKELVLEIGSGSAQVSLALAQQNKNMGVLSTDVFAGGVSHHDIENEHEQEFTSFNKKIISPDQAMEAKDKELTMEGSNLNSYIDSLSPQQMRDFFKEAYQEGLKFNTQVRANVASPFIASCGLILRKIGGQWRFLMAQRSLSDTALPGVFGLPSGGADKPLEDRFERVAMLSENLLTHEDKARQIRSMESVPASFIREINEELGIDVQEITARADAMAGLAPNASVLIHNFVYVDQHDNEDVHLDAELNSAQWVPLKLLLDSENTKIAENIRLWLLQKSPGDVRLISGDEQFGMYRKLFQDAYEFQKNRDAAQLGGKKENNRNETVILEHPIHLAQGQHTGIVFTGDQVKHVSVYDQTDTAQSPVKWDLVLFKDAENQFHVIGNDGQDVLIEKGKDYAYGREDNEFVLSVSASSLIIKAEGPGVDIIAGAPLVIPRPIVGKNRKIIGIGSESFVFEKDRNGVLTITRPLLAIISINPHETVKLAFKDTWWQAEVTNTDDGAVVNNITDGLLGVFWGDLLKYKPLREESAQGQPLVFEQRLDMDQQMRPIPVAEGQNIDAIIAFRGKRYTFKGSMKYGKIELIKQFGDKARVPRGSSWFQEDNDELMVGMTLSNVLIFDSLSDGVNIRVILQEKGKENSDAKLENDFRAAIERGDLRGAGNILGALGEISTGIRKQVLYPYLEASLQTEQAFFSEFLEANWRSTFTQYIGGGDLARAGVLLSSIEKIKDEEFFESRMLLAQARIRQAAHEQLENEKKIIDPTNRIGRLKIWQRFDRDYYSLMGIPTNATKDQIKKAYRALSFLFHTDRNPDDKVVRQGFNILGEALEVLTKDRSEYDQWYQQRQFNSGSDQSMTGQIRREFKILRKINGYEIKGKKNGLTYRLEWDTTNEPEENQDVLVIHKGKKVGSFRTGRRTGNTFSIFSVSIQSQHRNQGITEALLSRIRKTLAIGESVDFDFVNNEPTLISLTKEILKREGSKEVLVSKTLNDNNVLKTKNVWNSIERLERGNVKKDSLQEALYRENLKEVISAYYDRYQVEMNDWVKKTLLGRTLLSAGFGGLNFKLKREKVKNGYLIIITIEGVKDKAMTVTNETVDEGQMMEEYEQKIYPYLKIDWGALPEWYFELFKKYGFKEFEHIIDAQPAEYASAILKEGVFAAQKILTSEERFKEAMALLADFARKIKDKKSNLNADQYYNTLASLEFSITSKERLQQAEDFILKEMDVKPLYYPLSNIEDAAKSLTKTFSEAELDLYWPDLMNIYLSSGRNGPYVVGQAIPMLKKLITSAETLVSVGEILEKMAKSSNHGFSTVVSEDALPIAVEFIDSEADLKEIGGLMVEAGNTLSCGFWPLKRTLYHFYLGSKNKDIKKKIFILSLRIQIASGEHYSRVLDEIIPNSLKTVFDEEDSQRWSKIAELAIASGPGASNVIGYEPIINSLRVMDKTDYLGNKPNPEFVKAVADHFPAFLQVAHDSQGYAWCVIHGLSMLSGQLTDGAKILEYGKVLNEISIKAGPKYATYVLDVALPGVSHLVKSPEDLRSIGETLISMSVEAGDDINVLFYYGFNPVAKNITSKEDIESYWKEIMAIHKAANSKAKLVLEKGIGQFSDLVKSLSNLRAVGKIFVALLNMTGEQAPFVFDSGLRAVKKFVNSPDDLALWVNRLGGLSRLINKNGSEEVFSDLLSNGDMDWLKIQAADPGAHFDLYLKLISAKPWLAYSIWSVVRQASEEGQLSYGDLLDMKKLELRIDEILTRSNHLIQTGFDYNNKDDIFYAYLGVRQAGLNLSLKEFKTRLADLAEYDQKYPGYFKSLFKKADGLSTIPITSSEINQIDTSKLNADALQFHWNELQAIKNEIDSRKWLDYFSKKPLTFKSQEEFYRDSFSMVYKKFLGGSNVDRTKNLVLLRNIILAQVLEDPAISRRLASGSVADKVVAFRTVYEDYINHLPAVIKLAPHAAGLKIANIRGLAASFKEFSAVVYGEIGKVKSVTMKDLQDITLVPQGFLSVFRGWAGEGDCSSYDDDDKGHPYTRAMHEDTLYYFIYIGTELDGYLGLMQGDTPAQKFPLMSQKRVLTVDTIQSPKLDGKETLTKLFVELQKFAVSSGDIGIALPADNLNLYFNFDNKVTIGNMELYQKAPVITVEPVHKMSWKRFADVFGEDTFNSMVDKNFRLIQMGPVDSGSDQAMTFNIDQLINEKETTYNVAGQNLRFVYEEKIDGMDGSSRFIWIDVINDSQKRKAQIGFIVRKAFGKIYGLLNDYPYRDGYVHWQHNFGLFVSPSYQKKSNGTFENIGKLLMASALEIARRYGAEEFFIKPVKENLPWFRDSTDYYINKFHAVTAVGHEYPLKIILGNPPVINGFNALTDAHNNVRGFDRAMKAANKGRFNDPSIAKYQFVYEGVLKSNPLWGKNDDYEMFQRVGMGSTGAFRSNMKVFKLILDRREIHIKPEGVGLDIGFGTVYDELIEFQRMFGLKVVHGSDYIDERVESIDHWLAYKHQNPKHFILHHADLLTLVREIPPGSIDVMISVGIWDSSLKITLEDMKLLMGMLSPGGVVYLTHSLVSSPEIKRYLLSKGDIFGSFVFRKKLSSGIKSAKEGGIDLTPANMNIEVKKEIASSPSAPRNDAGIKFHLDPAMLEELKNARGFVPVIINVEQLKDLRAFLTVN